MKLPAGPWDGAQPRTHVLKVLTDHGVLVEKNDGDWYTLIDKDGDAEVMLLPNPVLRDVVVHLYRRFGELHEFSILELRRMN